MTKQLGRTGGVTWIVGLARSCVICLLLAASTVTAREIYVNNQTGSDQNMGTADAPLRSARRAVAMADAGDVGAPVAGAGHLSGDDHAGRQTRHLHRGSRLHG